MTVQVTNSVIQINNSAGQLKFTSNDKLVYKRVYQEGTVDFNGTDLYVPFAAINSFQDILVGSMRINSCTGVSQATSAIIGLDLPIGSLMVDFDAYLGEFNSPKATTEIIALSVVKSNLVFRGTRAAASYYDKEWATFSTGIRNTNITYKVSIWSYL